MLPPLRTMGTKINTLLYGTNLSNFVQSGVLCDDLFDYYIHETIPYGFLSNTPFGSSITKDLFHDCRLPADFRQMTGKDRGVSHMIHTFTIPPQYRIYWLLY